jgi:hypothetical protein
VAPPADAPWKFSLDVGVRSQLLFPALDSAATFKVGGSVGTELGVTLPAHWHVRTGIDVGSITAGSTRYYITTVKPGLSYDAFSGPTAFMSFEVEGGWLTATATDLALVDNKPCAGAGTSMSMYLGDHVNFRTEVRYLEVFGAIHLVTIGVGFDVIGN